MFQNLNETEGTREEMANKINIFANIISKKYIILYIIAFMVSMTTMGYDCSPFAFAIVGACIANEIPIIAVIIGTLVANGISAGFSGTLYYIITLLIFFVSFFIREPKYNESTRNEKLMLARRIFIVTLLVNIIKMLANQFLVYDLLVNISYSLVTIVFYKIFVNSLTIITNYNEKMAFSIEEVLGTSLLLSIAVCCFGNLNIFGFSVRNVLSIFIVLVLGWKKGVLIGATAGATIGVTLGIIANNSPMIVAAYCISGMVSGILNKFGKLGVIGGFILGNIILSYMATGLAANAILFKEILIAGIGLLAIPKNINLNIENILGENKFLPMGSFKSLNKSKDTANKLNDVSKVIQSMANNYKSAAVTLIDEEDIKEKNKQIFISELLNNIELMQDNILYDSIEDVEGEIVNTIFTKLMDKGFITDKELINILASNNNYVVGFDKDEKETTRDVEKMTNAINSAYRVSKMNFIWTAKMQEEKQNFETQLNVVSKTISELAEDIKEEENSDILYSAEKEQIILLLKQKEIIVQDISICKKENEKYKIELYIEKSDIKEKTIENNILKIISKVLKESIIIDSKEKIDNENIIKYKLASDDKYIIDIGQAVATKDEMKVSGDSIVSTKLKDRKILVCNK